MTPATPRLGVLRHAKKRRVSQRELEKARRWLHDFVERMRWEDEGRRIDLMISNRTPVDRMIDRIGALWQAFIHR